LLTLNLNEFDFDLPDELIAHHPKEKRDSSKLLHFSQKDTVIADLFFSDITNLLPSNSVIVLNNTKVIKARVLTKRKTGALIECFFTKRIKHNNWEVLLKNSKRIQIGESLIVDNDHTIKVLSKNEKEATIKIEGPLSDF
jgi:S-adenosylmethionine:tRNA ribosyltransferase-isomerase